MNRAIKRAGLCWLAIFILLGIQRSAAEAIDITQTDAEAICRVLYAEAAGQPLTGKLAVVEVILNRMRIYKASAEQIVNSPHQFEPVQQANGDWKNLRLLTPQERIECGTILKLKFDGILVEVAPGADHFQNPSIVARRAAKGAVNANLVDFGKMPVVTEIGDHRFYKSGKPIKSVQRGMKSMLTTIDNTGSQDTELVNENGD